LRAAHRCRNVLRVIKRAFPLVDHARHTSTTQRLRLRACRGPEQQQPNPKNNSAP
jgi:hypothetical protein